MKWILSFTVIILIANACSAYNENQHLPTIKLKVDHLNVHPTVLWLSTLLSDRVVSPQGTTIGFQTSQTGTTNLTTRELIIQKGLDPEGLVTIDGRSYFFEDDDLMSYAEAHKLCNDIDMRLISFETEEKQKIIYDYMLENGRDAYYSTSLTKVYSTWIWSSSGKLLTYTSWGPNQPDWHGDKNGTCVYFYSNKWKDETCAMINYVLCEQRC